MGRWTQRLKEKKLKPKQPEPLRQILDVSGKGEERTFQIIEKTADGHEIYTLIGEGCKGFDSILMEYEQGKNVDVMSEEGPIKEPDIQEAGISLEQIPHTKLSELTRRNVAMEIYSEILGGNVWLCFSEEMATQVREDEPGAVIYTANELKELIRLNPTPEELKRIHNIKTVFPTSKIHCESCDCKTCTPQQS